MTVKQLKKQLEKYDENLKVVGYYYYMDYDDINNCREIVSYVDSVKLSDDNSFVYILS